MYVHEYKFNPILGYRSFEKSKNMVTLSFNGENCSTITTLRINTVVVATVNLNVYSSNQFILFRNCNITI